MNMYIFIYVYIVVYHISENTASGAGWIACAAVRGRAKRERDTERQRVTESEREREREGNVQRDVSIGGSVQRFRGSQNVVFSGRFFVRCCRREVLTSTRTLQRTFADIYIYILFTCIVMHFLMAQVQVPTKSRAWFGASTCLS